MLSFFLLLGIQAQNVVTRVGRSTEKSDDARANVDHIRKARLYVMLVMLGRGPHLYCLTRKFSFSVHALCLQNLS
jgi:hypothetical protein